MDATIRVLVILALIAYSVFRIVRWFRYGMAKRVTVVPPPVGMFPQDAGTSAANPLAPATPTPPPTWLAGITTVAVWVGSNLLVGAVLFMVPALSGVPLIWRLFLQIFANFYLLPWAKRVGARRAAG